jgi:glycosyltransferase involved in cell wall biosynthesis
MTISVVIPAFNAEKYLEYTLLSIINQTRKADEIIVHDDNSQDLTTSICKKYYPNIKYFLENNGPSGFVNGWNKALSLASSDYIAILHQDDLLYPTFLEEAEIAFTKYPQARHIFSLCDYISDSGSIISYGEQAVKNHYIIGETIILSGQDYVKAYQKTFPGVAHIHRCPGVMTHKSIFESGCYYNPEAGHIADDDFFYRVGQHTPVIGIIKSLAAYRIHRESETGRIGDVNLVARLSKDYLFQVEQWKDSSWMPGDTYNYFVKNAYKYTNRLLGYGIKKAKIDLIKLALVNLDKLESKGFHTNEKKIKRLSNLLKLLLPSIIYYYLPYYWIYGEL